MGSMCSAGSGPQGAGSSTAVIIKPLQPSLINQGLKLLQRNLEPPAVNEAVITISDTLITLLPYNTPLSLSPLPHPHPQAQVALC